eukprot:4061161-Prymnesium_polylepis.1
MEPVAAEPTEAAPVGSPAGQPAAPAAPKAKAKRGEGGMPRHVRPIVTKLEGTKYGARLRWLPHGATTKAESRYDFIPGGPWPMPEEAAAAQALAQAALVSGGPEAVWADGLPGANRPRQKRGADYWEAQKAAHEAKAAEKAAEKAAREAAEAARPKKPRRNKAPQSQTTVPLPANRDEITVPCTRDFLVDPPAAGAENTVPAWAQPPPPIPVPAGLEG